MSTNTPENNKSNAFITAFNDVATEVHATAREKGWWDGDKVAGDVHHWLRQTDAPKELIEKVAKLLGRNVGESIALMHSELSETLEAARHGNPPSDKIGDQGFTGIEEELADVIVRIMDVSKAHGWRVAEALEAKRAYNKGRAYKHGNKAF